MLEIRLNGEIIQASGSVLSLVEARGLADARIAVERNQAIVPRSVWGQTALAAGDELEIVHFVGGG